MIMITIILCLNVNLGKHLAHAGSSWKVGSCIVPYNNDNNMMIMNDNDNDNDTSIHSYTNLYKVIIRNNKNFYLSINTNS